MSRWIATFTDPADASLAFAGVRNLDELSGFQMTSDGLVTCDYGYSMRFDDVERLDASLAALIRKAGKTEKGSRDQA